MSYVSFISQRYLRSGRNAVSSRSSRRLRSWRHAGIGNLIVALSVLGGFEREITEKVIGFTSHVQVVGFQNQPLHDFEETLRASAVPFPW